MREAPINQRVNQMMMNMTGSKLGADPQFLSQQHLLQVKKGIYKNMTPKF